MSTITAIPTTRTAPAKALPDALPLAVAQLARSERGRQALADIRALLKNGAVGLDRENQHALFEILVQAYTPAAPAPSSMPATRSAMKNANSTTATKPRKKQNRVQFPTQRVALETYVKAHRLRARYGSLSRVLDAALANLDPSK